VRRRAVVRGAVLGLDLSLRRPAGVVIPDGWEVGDWASLLVDSHETADPGPGPEGQLRRQVLIAHRMVALAHRGRAEHVFVEDYAFSKNSRAVTMLAELRAVVNLQFWEAIGIVPRPVPASSCRKLLLGECRAGAKQVVEATLRKHGAPFKNDDECDAFAVASYGTSEIGRTALSFAGEVEWPLRAPSRGKRRSGSSR
jgi:Holliday junction resolvasome RuvABC endonuclease subunit